MAGRKLANERIRKFGNEKMSSDKNSFLRGLTNQTIQMRLRALLKRLRR